MASHRIHKRQDGDERKLYIHIGTHKTGTTSIQAFLNKQRGALQRAGIYVPKAGQVGPGHHNIGWQLRGDQRFDPDRGGLPELVAELRRTSEKTAVISSEDLEYLVRRPKLLKRLETAIKATGWHPEYIVFIRRPDDYAPSLYTELRHHGLQLSYYAFAWEIVRRRAFSMRGDWYFDFDCHRFLDAWRKAAKGRLRVIKYEKAAAGGGVVPKFCRMIGASKETIRLAKSAPRTRPSAHSIPPLARKICDWAIRLRFRLGVPPTRAATPSRPKISGMG